MSEHEPPKEPEKTIYQRDKTAREPVKPSEPPKPPPKPRVKPKKVFVPKKVTLKSDKPQEYRVRHIRLSSVEPAEMIRQTLIDFKKELAEQPMEDPDKEYHDREKVEKFFAKLAKKYSNCNTRGLGGELGWVYPEMKIVGEIMTQDLVDHILKTEKHVISELIKTRLGVHITLNCESRVHVPKIKEGSKEKARTIPGTPS
ncbi:MAG: peptidylprolyl isomerase [Nitrospinaceae bacterium]